MTIDGKVLVAVAMMLGATATAGCKKASDANSQPEITPVVLTPEDPAAPSAAPAASSDAPAASADVPVASAPAASASAPSANAPSSNAPAIKDKLALVAAAAHRPAPPASREETPGRAPSAHHVWQRGFWRYDAPRTAYAWVPGYWEDTAVAAPMAPPPVIDEDPGYAPSEEYVYAPGYWRYSGREYVWVQGHWAHRADRWNTARVAHHRYDARPYAPAHHAASRPSSHPRFAPEHHAHPTMHHAPARMPARGARRGHG